MNFEILNLLETVFNDFYNFSKLPGGKKRKKKKIINFQYF